MCKPKLAEMWFVMDRQALDQMLSSLLAQSMQLSIGICTVIVLILKLKSMLITKVYLQKQQLEELNAKLMQNNKELEENLKSKNDFILSFSHELRNPLNSIVGNLELIGMRNTDDTIQKYLSAAKHSGEFLMFLINNILDSAKAETNQLEKTEMSINTSDFFNKSWSIFGSLIRSRGLIGELHLGVNLPATLKIDSHRTMQIMFNLIGNAAKFTETGSVKVVVSWIAGDKLEDKMLLPSESDESVDESGSYYTTQAGTAAFPKSVSYSITGIKLCSSPEKPAKVPYDESGLQMLSTTIEDVEHNKDSKMQEGFLKMEVIDTGIGISSEEVANLFKKYSQLSGEHKRLGSGLGLWITHHLCKLMQGDIKAFSKPKQGSTFVTLLQAKARGTIINKNLKAPVVPTLELPAKSKAFRKEVPAPPPIPSLPLARDNIMAKDNRIRVLVVEDNEFNQMLIKNFLENLGVLVVGIAPNGLEAVKLLTVTNRLIDAVILDIEMPIMDGIQAAQIIRQYEGSNKLKPIYMAMVTGNCNEQQFKLCRQKEGPIRADAIFRKPFAYSDCQNMVTGIAQYVDRK
jgi:signal transduction histidine kinase/CheY-like chemotaxis protein